VYAGTINNPIGELPFVIKRYKYEAKKILEYSKECSPEELHVVVGCRHERPLEYLLSNSSILD
jgi:hypothetical protein